MVKYREILRLQEQGVTQRGLLLVVVKKAGEIGVVSSLEKDCQI